MIQRATVAASGVFLAFAGISEEHMGMLVAVGAIVLGYAWLERRVERIVKRELGAHEKVEVEWRGELEEKIKALQSAVERNPWRSH